MKWINDLASETHDGHDPYCFMHRAHVHKFMYSENKGFPSLGDLCREVIAKDHKYYLNVVKWGT